MLFNLCHILRLTCWRITRPTTYGECHLWTLLWLFIVRSLFGFGVVIPRLKQRAKAMVVNLLSYPRVPHILGKRLPSSLVLYFLLTLRLQCFQHLGRAVDALRGTLVIHGGRRENCRRASTSDLFAYVFGCFSCDRRLQDEGERLKISTYSGYSRHRRLTHVTIATEIFTFRAEAKERALPSCFVRDCGPSDA